MKMPPSNIAKIFGPTLVGYSSNDPDQHAIFTETIIQASVSVFCRRFTDSIGQLFHPFLNSGYGNVIEDPSRLLGTVCKYQVERKSERKER